MVFLLFFAVNSILLLVREGGLRECRQSRLTVPIDNCWLYYPGGWSMILVGRARFVVLLVLTILFSVLLLLLLPMLTGSAGAPWCLLACCLQEQEAMERQDEEL